MQKTWLTGVTFVLAGLSLSVAGCKMGGLGDQIQDYRSDPRFISLRNVQLADAAFQVNKSQPVVFSKGGDLGKGSLPPVPVVTTSPSVSPSPTLEKGDMGAPAPSPSSNPDVSNVGGSGKGDEPFPPPTDGKGGNPPPVVSPLPPVIPPVEPPPIVPPVIPPVLPPPVIPPVLPPNSCDIFVHLKGHRPEWSWVFIPAVPLANGLKDDAVMPYAGLRVPNCGIGFGPVCNYAGYTYQLSVGNQPGSPDCQAFYSENYSPLVIDLGNKGIALTAPTKGVRFDLLGDGAPISISWPKDPANVAFLALPSANGTITSINQLFGNNTVGPDGKKAANGFEALRKYDANHDGFIDAHDPIYSQLRLWLDLNSDGKVEPGELRTLAEMGLRAIDLNYVNKIERNDYFGNETRQRSVVDLNSKDPAVRMIFDLWLVPGID